MAGASIAGVSAEFDAARFNDAENTGDMSAYRPLIEDYPNRTLRTALSGGF